MPFIKVSSPKANIWEENPHLVLITEFKEFKAREGNKRSSDILKAIYYIWDPKSDLKDSGISGDDLVTEVSTNLLKDPKFNWHEYEEIRQSYLRLNITKLESMLLGYENEILNVAKILENWKATKDDVAEKAKVTKLYKELFKDYQETAAEVKAEFEEHEELYGGYTKSKIEAYGDD